MARRYYDTQQKLYQLFIDHSIMSVFIEEFEIEKDTIKAVCDFLLANHDEITDTELSAFYNDSDLIDELAEIYGYDTPPWTQYVSTKGTLLTELLNYTLYFYKFSVTDNFYEKNIINFLPEYDREQINSSDKLRLTIEALGHKLDIIEDKIARLKDIYNIDECPDELLDYLGQNIGYEREDFTLSNVSFRELLKNIIEIYKIKGTNYSFSFFFKFLGFEINLKEFFFNRNVENPEAFPSADDNNAEYFLTTKNPLMETGETTGGIRLSPAHHLEQTRNLNDWETELQSLIDHECYNPSAYLRGLETFNNDGSTWHSNPWTYFKTNLIEYELNPFLDRLSLTASDNETIRKYVKFLSPTYLFTWININLRPWVEDINLLTNTPESEELRQEITISLGDIRPTPTPWPMLPAGQMGVPENPSGIYTIRTEQDLIDLGFGPPYNYYEDFQILELFNTGENLFINLYNNFINTDADSIGTPLRRDGTHIRQPGNSQFIADATHGGIKRPLFDFFDIGVKHVEDETYIEHSNIPFPSLPVLPTPFNGKNIITTNTVSFLWDDVSDKEEYRIQIASNYNMTNILIDEIITTNTYVTSESLHNDIYYWRLRVKNELTGDDELLRWGPWSTIWYFYMRYNPYPFHNSTINRETLYVTPNYIWTTQHTQQLFISVDVVFNWHATSQTDYYEIMISDGFTNSTYTSSSTTKTIELFNKSYTWQYRSKKLNGTYTDWSSEIDFTINFPETV